MGFLIRCSLFLSEKVSEKNKGGELDKIERGVKVAHREGGGVFKAFLGWVGRNRSQLGKKRTKVSAGARKDDWLIKLIAKSHWNFLFLSSKEETQERGTQECRKVFLLRWKKVTF